MIHLTQLVYVHPGQEATFQEFEDAVFGLLAKYGGELLLRLRPEPGSKIGGSAETPYEVHLLRFESADGLARYASDEERQRLLPLKDRSVRSSLLIKGDVG